MDKKITLISGASRGIGRAVATRLARENHFVMILARNAEELTELARAVQQNELPEHLRGSADKRDAELEWGQAYMMHLTTAILLNIDVEAALARAIRRIYERSQAKREKADATR